MRKYELDYNDESVVRRSIENDLVNRNDKLVSFIRMLNVIDENYVISIDGDWGSGKSFFVKQVESLILNPECKVLQDKEEAINMLSEKYIPVYYNAWECDDHSSALESLLYTIVESYPTIHGKVSMRIEDFKRIVKDLVGNLASVKTAGVLNQEVINNVGVTKKELVGEVGSIEKKKKYISSFLNQLTEDNKRVLLIIDDLDRCKPDFAVKILETIKHFYTNNNLTVVVVTNNKQLSCSLKKYYGNDFDGYKYLDRIYDSTITLLTDNIDQYLQRHCNIGTKAFYLEAIFVYLCHYLQFSYRECNRFATSYRIIENYTKIDKHFLESQKVTLFRSAMLLIAIALKICDLERYEIFVSGKGNKEVELFVAFCDDDIDSWLSSLVNGNYIEEYKRVFSEGTENVYRERFNIKDLLSMLGNNINIENE